MWNKMTEYIRYVAKEELSESKGMAPPSKETSWWNEEVKTTIKNKQICYRNLDKNKNIESFEKYKLAKKEAREKMYNDIYDILDSKDEKKGIYKIA